MIPQRASFTTNEWSVVRRQRTPLLVQRWLNGLPYNHERDRETLRTFRGVVAHRSAHCLEAALSAATVLQQHGYPSLLLDLMSADKLDHVVFLYQRAGKWGTVGRSRDPGLHGRKPVFASLAELVDSYADPFVDLTGRIVGYGVFDLAELGNYNWRLSPRNVWRVARALIEMPHQRFHMANGRYRLAHERYRAFKARFPDRKPLYYSNRSCWKSGYPRGG